MALTVSLQIWGLFFKERICSPREQILSFKSSPQWGGEMGLDYFMRKYIFSPLEHKKIIFWNLPAIAIYFQIPWLFPDFPNPF